MTGLTKESVRAGKNKRKGHESDQIGHGHGGEYNSILSPEKVSAFAQAHVPGASGVIGGFNTVAGSYQSVQHYIGREVDGGGFVPPEGPPRWLHFLFSVFLLSLNLVSFFWENSGHRVWQLR